MDCFRLMKTLAVGEDIRLNIKVNETGSNGSDSPYVTDVVCNGEEVLFIPDHWHKDHAETMTIFEGRLEVTLGGEKMVLKAGDPSVRIPPRVVHSLRSFKGEVLRFRETTDYEGMEKALFFNDLCSRGKLDSFWHAMRAFYDGDTYVALPLYFRFIDEVFMTLVGGLAHLFVEAKPKTL